MTRIRRDGRCLPGAVIWALVIAFGLWVIPVGAADFVLYEKGIRTAEFQFLNSFAGDFSSRQRDRFTGRWTASVERRADNLEQLPGSLRLLAAVGHRLAGIDWGAERIVRLANDHGPPLEFERYAPVQAKVGGDVVKADRWIQRNGGKLRYGVPPLDLIIGDDSRFLGAIDPSNDNVLVMAGYEAMSPTFKLWRQPDVSQATYGIRKLPRAMVAMKDGTRLATYVYLPAGEPADSGYPVLLTRTPYDASRVIDWSWHYVARGYAVVAQDVRGRYASEGEFWVDIHEIGDGDETLAWIAGQEWANGNIGMMGASYPGHTQWMAAARGNPALRALVPIVSTGTPHVDMPYIGGAFNAGTAAWAFRMDGGSNEPRNWDTLLRRRPYKDIDRIALGKESRIWNQYLEHQLYDDYWKASDWYRYSANIDVPALHVSGWYDDDHPGTLANWAMMARNGRSHQRMILGAWRHSINADRAINGVAFGPEVVRVDLNFQIQQWYDRFLKGIRNGVELGPAVEYFSVGDNQWRSASAWPPRDSRVRNWYLHGDGQAASAKSGSLSTVLPVEGEVFDSFRYDPEEPTPSLIDVSLNEQSLPDDYSRIELRPDVAVYQTAVLTEPIRIAGPIRAVLYASTSAKDTDWIVRLSDVDPDGRAWRLVEGIIRARFRNSFEKAELLTPGRIERYEISMRSHANTFLPGHRIRVSISSAAAGYIFPNSNTGEDEATVTRTEVAHQEIYHDPQHPSHIQLPVAP